MSVSLPEPPKAASSWVDLADKIQRAQLVPILGLAVIAWMFWTANTQNRLDQQAAAAAARVELAAAESRTRAALVECKAEAAAQAGRTRDVVRDSARALAPAAAPAPAGSP